MANDLNSLKWMFPEDKLKKINNLPTLPKTFNEILSQINKENTSVNKLEEIIIKDPLLTAKILRYVNSPIYAQAGPINNVKKAITVYGFNAMKTLVLGLSLNNILVTSFSNEFFSPKSFWHHSMGVAQACRYICEMLNEPAQEDFFTAGLLHDIGLLLMCMYFKEETDEIIKIKQAKDIDFNQAEDIYLLRIKHADLGVFIAKKWGLSDFHIKLIEYHHDPLKAGEYSYKVSILFFAEQICEKLGLGWNFKESNKILLPKYLPLDRKKIMRLIEIMKEEKNMLEEIWKISFES